MTDSQEDYRARMCLEKAGVDLGDWVYFRTRTKPWNAKQDPYCCITRVIPVEISPQLTPSLKAAAAALQKLDHVKSVEVITAEDVARFAEGDYNPRRPQVIITWQ